MDRTDEGNIKYVREDAVEMATEWEEAEEPVAVEDATEDTDPHADLTIREMQDRVTNWGLDKFPPSYSMVMFDKLEEALYDVKEAAEQGDEASIRLRLGELSVQVFHLAGRCGIDLAEYMARNMHTKERTTFSIVNRDITFVGAGRSTCSLLLATTWLALGKIND